MSEINKPHDGNAEPTPWGKMPSGIPYIVGNEAAERFSFYGMKAILFVYMTRYLLNAAGQPDPMTPEDAKATVHLFVASAYFFPVAGAILSDWMLGKYRTIFWLSLVYCLGHAALAAIPGRWGLLAGLTLIAIGAGGIKPCVSAHVGDQFGEHNKDLLPRVFSWFYFSINFGAFFSTIITPILLQKCGPHWGPHVAFGLPGLLMFLATFVFWLGRKKFVHVKPGGIEFLRETFSIDGLRALTGLIPLYLFVAMFWALYDQTASAWVEQAESMDRRWLGIEWLSSQIQAINPILVLVLIPICTYAVYPALNSFFQLTALRKVSIGFFLTILGFGISAWIESQITGGHVIRDADVKGADEQTLAEKSLRNGVDQHELIVRMREHRAWTIKSIRWEVALHSESKPIEAWDGAAPEYQVTAEVGPTPTGPWNRVASAEIQLSRQRASELKLQQPASAAYVRLVFTTEKRTDSPSLEWKWPHTIEVTANEAAPPADAHPHAVAVWPDVAAVGFRPSIFWQFVAYVVLTLAEVMVSITCLEFSYTQSPNRMKSLVMSLYLLSISLGNALTALVNVFIQNPDGTSKLPGASYYWFFTALMAVASVGFLIVAAMYREKSYIQSRDRAE